MKARVPVAHLKRLSSLLASMRAEVRGELQERAGKAVEWIAGVVAEVETGDGLREMVNSLRAEWQAFPRFDAKEEHHFNFNAEDFANLKPDDWQVMREFLAYKPREREKLWQVEKREWFLKAPADCLRAAKSWARSHRKTSAGKTPGAVSNAENGTQDGDVKALCQELFSHLKNPE